MTEHRRRRHRAPRTRAGIGLLSAAGFVGLVGALGLAPRDATALVVTPATPSPTNAAPLGKADTTTAAPRPRIVIERQVGGDVGRAPGTPPPTTPLTTPTTHGRTHGSR